MLGLGWQVGAYERLAKLVNFFFLNLNRNRVVTSRMEWVTAKNALYTEAPTFPGTVKFNCLTGVLRTCRSETTNRSSEDFNPGFIWGEIFLI